MRKANVLVVDDKPANLLALEVLLGEEYRVIVASSGERALEVLRSRKDIDLILLDVQMPGMDGFETATEIKKIDDCKDIPIIFVTAIYTEDPFIKKGYAVGGIDYFSKPFDPDVLKMKVAVYASFRQKAQLLSEREAQVKETEELLRVGRKLSAVLESLSVGVMIADNEGRICQTTDEVDRIFRSMDPTREDAYGAILGWWDENKRLIKGQSGPLSRALHGGDAAPAEAVEIRCVDGTLKKIYVSASPLRGLDGRSVGAVVLVQDLTDAKTIEADLASRVSRFVSLGVELEESAVR